MQHETNFTCNSFLCLIIGPMFSGKSTELLRKMRMFQVAGLATTNIVHTSDTRYVTSSTSSPVVSTHDRTTQPAVAVTRLGEIDLCKPSDVSNSSVIGIDEGQFFPDLVEWVLDAVEIHKKIVIVAALDGSFLRTPFDVVARLIPVCDDVIKLHAVCMACKKKKAPFTSRRIVNSENSNNTDDVICVGGAELYQATCRSCWLKLKTPTVEH